MNIVQALDDAELFQPLFAGASWAPWRAFLKSLFGLSMSDAELALYREHTKRQTSPTKPFNEAALVIGRRGGKSRILALIAVFLGCFKDYTPYLATGEVATISIIASDRRQARVIFRFISGMLDATPMLRAMVTDESAEAISLSNRVVIEIHTCSFRATRGYSYGAVLCDEIAFWRDETSANPDTEILRALRPGLASIPGSMLLIASSPYRKASVLYNVFARHFGKDDARTLVWRAATLEMNPSLSPAVIEEAYADDPASAASEYGAQFRDDINDFVSRDVVEACVIRGRGELLPARGITYRAFVDPSGGSSDSMTLAICHRHQDTAILDAVREVKPPFSPEQVVKDFAATLRSYHVSRVTGDHYGGEWPRERFRLAGIQYVLSEQPKGDIYLNSLPLLNSGKVQLLDHQRLISQFIGLERRTARSGRDSIDHSPGQHDDIVNAVCGGLLRANTRRCPCPRARWSDRVKLAFAMLIKSPSPASFPFSAGLRPHAAWTRRPARRGATPQHRRTIMKRCASPANTTCIYQRIARDQADPDAPDLGAPDPGASSDAYNALCVFLQENLSPDVLGEAEALLRQFLDKSGDGNLAADEPVSGRSRPVLSMDEMQRRVATGAKISAGRTIAQQYLFNQRFPDAARIRSV